jgi:hypothetical protein
MFSAFLLGCFILRGWSSRIRSQERTLSRRLFYENLEIYKQIGGLFSSWSRKHFLIGLKIFREAYLHLLSFFFKFEIRFTEKRVIHLKKTYRYDVHGIFSCTFIKVLIV